MLPLTQTYIKYSGYMNHRRPDERVNSKYSKTATEDFRAFKININATGQTW